MIAYRCRSCNMTLTEAEKSVWVGCDVCDGEGLIVVPPSAEGVVSLPEFAISDDDRERAKWTGTPPYHRLSVEAKEAIFCRERQLLSALTSLTAAQERVKLLEQQVAKFYPTDRA